jgi:hypothetical protein
MQRLKWSGARGGGGVFEAENMRAGTMKVRSAARKKLLWWEDEEADVAEIAVALFKPTNSAHPYYWPAHTYACTPVSLPAPATFCYMQQNNTLEFLYNWWKYLVSNFNDLHTEISIYFIRTFLPCYNINIIVTIYTNQSNYHFQAIVISDRDGSSWIIQVYEHDIDA